MDLVTFTEEILNGKLHFLCGVISSHLTICSKSDQSFVKIVNDWRSLRVLAKSSILDVWLGSEYASGLLWSFWDFYCVFTDLSKNIWIKVTENLFFTKTLAEVNQWPKGYLFEALLNSWWHRQKYELEDYEEQIFILSRSYKSLVSNTAQKIKFSIKDFFSKCEQICSKLWIWSHLLKKSSMENFIFCAVWFQAIWLFVVNLTNVCRQQIWNTKYIISVYFNKKLSSEIP